MGDVPSERAAPVRARAMAVVFAAQALIVWWVSDSEIARSVYLICYSLMMPTVLFLPAARALRGPLRLTEREILLGYIVLTATVPIVGFGGLRFLMTGVGYLRHFAETQPQWRRYLPFSEQLPLLNDPAAVSAFFKGSHSVPWSAWAAPMAFFSVYLLALGLVWLGLAAAVRRLWIREERLSFPTTVVVTEFVTKGAGLFGHPLFWIGCAVPAVLQSLLALHDWFPSVPALTLKAQDLRPLVFTSPPWNAVPSLSIGFYPMAIGLAFLAPRPISFSCWAFWILTRLTYVAGSALGIESAGTGAARFPYPEEQASGAWLALAALLLLGVARRRREAIGGDERGLTVGLMVCAVCGLSACAAMIAWCGMALGMAIATAAVYVAYVLAGARVRAETGAMWTFAPLVWTPGRLVQSAAGLPAQPGAPLLTGAMFDLMHVDIRAQSLPFVMEGLKIAESVGIRLRTVAAWVAVGSVTALALGWWSGLEAFHAAGAATSKSNAYALVKAQIGFTQMDALTTARPGADIPGLIGAAAGALMTVLLTLGRARFAGFPLHPLGYVLCNTLTMNSFFMPFLIAWTATTLVQRYGGMRAYRSARSFFVGLILGDIVIQAFWTLTSRMLNVPVYQFLS